MCFNFKYWRPEAKCQSTYLKYLFSHHPRPKYIPCYMYMPAALGFRLSITSSLAVVVQWFRQVNSGGGIGSEPLREGRLRGLASAVNIELPPSGWVALSMIIRYVISTSKYIILRGYWSRSRHRFSGSWIELTRLVNKAKIFLFNYCFFHSKVWINIVHLFSNMLPEIINNDASAISKEQIIKEMIYNELFIVRSWKGPNMTQVIKNL